MLLTSAVISRTENERFIPGAIQGTDIVVPAGGTATPYYSITAFILGIIVITIIIMPIILTR